MRFSFPFFLSTLHNKKKVFLWHYHMTPVTLRVGSLFEVAPVLCATSQLVTRQSEDSRRATLLITSHRLYQHLLTITNAKQPANQPYCKYDLSSPSCIGSCRSACRGATQPCSVRPATSRPIHPHPPANRKSLVLKARTSHL